MDCKTVLTIAGSDSSGGAGIQADLKTMLAHGVYGMSAVTALTAQNTQGVTDILEATPQFLAAELDAVFDDIPPDAVKVGMVASAALIETIAACLSARRPPHIVVDPVMVATSGAVLLQEDATHALTTKLFPLATVVTPNLLELIHLAGHPLPTEVARIDAAREIVRHFGCAVLVKGGHDETTADDLLVTRENVTRFPGKRIDTLNTHGTGCTLSSAIAANLAKGQILTDAVKNAKAYVAGALAQGLTLGHGNGPLPHGYALHGAFFDA